MYWSEHWCVCVYMYMSFLLHLMAVLMVCHTCRQRRKKKVLYIATIEKGNGLVNSLIELEIMSRVGLVVVDEVIGRLITS